MTETTDKGYALSNAAAVVGSGLLALVGALIFLKTTDPAFAFHGVLFALGGILAAIAVMANWNKSFAGDNGYMDGPIRVAVVFAIFWGFAGVVVGDLIAWQLAFPALNFDLPWTSFGRLRPLHTSAVIFAFGGNALFATSFYVVQRTCRAPLFGGPLVGMVRRSGATSCSSCWPASGYVLGITAEQGIRRARVVRRPLADRRLGRLPVGLPRHDHQAQGAAHLRGELVLPRLHRDHRDAAHRQQLAVPVSFFGPKSYSLFSGVQDAMTQWWYGHNAVGFFLTAGFLGIMYYFMPKRVERPVYSYRLSIIHFWTLIFLYIWAGPHHLHYTALPDWAQTLGMTFSIMLWMPSWGGMINGLMTLSGAWDKLRTDPVVRLLVVSVAFYGMSTFEGPLMSIKAVNSLSHYTDWTIGHVHSGALGWVAMVSFGAIYCLVPWLWQRKAALLDAAGGVALLDRDAGHPALHHLDVGFGHHAGSDVARLR